MSGITRVSVRFQLQGQSALQRSTDSPDLVDGFCISPWTMLCYHFEDPDPVKQSCPVKTFTCFAISKGFTLGESLSNVVTVFDNRLKSPPHNPEQARQLRTTGDVLQCFTLKKDFYHSPPPSKPKPAQHRQCKTKWPLQSDGVLATQKQLLAALHMLTLCSQNTAVPLNNSNRQ